jgi:hypothetical protein
MELLLSRHQTVTVLFLNRYCLDIELLLSRHRTVTVLFIELLLSRHRTVTVLFLNCYCLTSPQIFNYIWRYRTPIQAKFMALER